MTEKKTEEVLSEHAMRRRTLLKNAGKVAVTAPAVALLLDRGARPAQAQSYDGTTPPEPMPR